MENEKLRYSVSGKSVFAKLSAMLMGLSILFRLLGYWGFWANKEAGFIYTQIALPIVCNLLFIVIVLYLGKKMFSMTAIPVLLGVVFFIVKSLSDGGVLHTAICILVCLIVAMVYIGTVFGVIRTKWLMIPLFALPLAYHIFVLDRNTLLANENAMSLADWLPEISVLCIMLALLLITFAMKKRDFSKPEAEPGEQELIDILLENEEPVGKTDEGADNEQTDGKTE